jgi:hypothetical protein
MGLDGGVPRGIHIGVCRNVTRVVASVFDRVVIGGVDGEVVKCVTRGVAKGEAQGVLPIVARGEIEGDDTTCHKVDNRLSDSIRSRTKYLLRHMLITSFTNSCRGMESRAQEVVCFVCAII